MNISVNTLGIVEETSHMARGRKLEKKQEKGGQVFETEDKREETYVILTAAIKPCSKSLIMKLDSNRIRSCVAPSSSS